MSDFYFNPDGSDELYHYGVPGMKWGQRKAQRLQKHLDKTIKREAKYDNKTLNSRAKVRSAMAKKYDKKIKSQTKRGMPGAVKVLNEQKQLALKDHDDGTKLIKKALSIKNKNITDFQKMKIKAVNDPSFKKSSQYKNAKKFFKSQKMSEVMHGRAMTLLQEASYVANGKSWTRGDLN